jgi:Na+/H+ antiporter NhaD/arsenite permease-like protein
MAIVDLAAILPFWLPMLLPDTMLGIRALRLVRLLRIFKLNRYFDAMKLLGDVIVSRKNELLGSLFVVIGSLEAAGVIARIAELFVKIGGDNLFLMYSLIVWGSVLMSAFIDNIPYVATMLPVVTGIAAMMGCNPTVLYFGLLSGATLGGNLTPIGASANIATIGILQKEGYKVKTSDFLKIGVPFTLTAVIMGYLFIWLVWAAA